ncbi:MAG TPA: nucleotide exchange factor GrpE [Pseudomonadales bacterium]|nr:nucleotide exchange factor GrpE [Pseudomonadales bacterium]
MTDPSQHLDPEADAAADAAPDLENAADLLEGAMAPDDEAQEPIAEGDLPEVDVELAAAREEIETLRDAALRAQAEVENVRRRTTREVENAHKFALEKFAAQLLPVIDSLQKSLEEVGRHAGGDEAYGAIKEGIELSERIFRDTLAKFGVEQVDPLGEPFDPERHEAMSMVEAPGAEPNSVIDVLQKGYTLNGRLLRAAMVVVAKAPAAK